MSTDFPRTACAFVLDLWVEVAVDGTSAGSRRPMSSGAVCCSKAMVGGIAEKLPCVPKVPGRLLFDLLLSSV